MRNILVIILMVLIGTSCVQDNNKISKERNFPTKQLLGIHKINFPKNVNLNKDIKGEVIFDLELDSIYKSDLIERYTFLYVTTEKLVRLNAKSIQNVDHEAFVDTLLRGKFNFKVKFKKTGERSLFLVIEDNLLLKSKDTSHNMVVTTREYGKELKVHVEE